MDAILEDEKMVDNATKKEKEVDNNKKNRREGKKEKSLSKPPTKIVIRNLPPTMTEMEFLEQTDPLPEHDFYYYCLADWSLGLEATCRAYIILKDLENVFLFRDRFDGYVFVDSSGIEYVAIVEYAPFQGFSKKKSRSNDNKENTIELEPHYNQYLESLIKEREDCTRSGDLKNDFTLDRKADDKMTSTPLLQYLASKKEKRREEAKKRNEEKKKLREEEKQKQLQLRTAKSTQTERGENKTSKATKEKDVTGQQKDKKNSRSKRRAERDQRRREEHEQRKKARDFPNDIQQSEKYESGNQKTDQNETKINSKSKSGKEIKLLRKTDLNESTETQKQTCQIETTKDNLTLNAVSNIEKEQVSETVLNFIRNAAAITESSKCDTTPFAINKPKLESQCSTEDRRIRNKDRPSIAIYQPKSRNSHSEEKEDYKDDDRKIDKKSKNNASRRGDRRSKQKLEAETERRVDHQRKSKTSDDDKFSPPNALDNRDEKDTF